MYEASRKNRDLSINSLIESSISQKQNCGSFLQVCLIISNFPVTDRTLNHNFPSLWAWKEKILLLWQTPRSPLCREYENTQATLRGWWHRPSVWVTGSGHYLLLASGHGFQRLLHLRPDRPLVSDVWLSSPCWYCQFIHYLQRGR